MLYTNLNSMLTYSYFILLSYVEISVSFICHNCYIHALAFTIQLQSMYRIIRKKELHVLLYGGEGHIQICLNIGRHTSIPATFIDVQRYTSLLLGPTD